MVNKINDIINKELQAIQSIPITDAYEDAISSIYEQVHKKGGKVVTAGIGKAGHIGHNIAMTFSSTGTRSVFVHPTEAQHGDLGILAENDILLLLSNSGKTREVLEFIQLAKNIYPDIKVISITGSQESELSKMSDTVLFTGGSKEIDRFNLVPTTSTTLMSIIGDILVVQLMEAIDFSREDYRKLHHSGYIGKMLK